MSANLKRMKEAIAANKAAEKAAGTPKGKPAPAPSGKPKKVKPPKQRKTRFVWMDRGVTAFEGMYWISKKGSHDDYTLPMTGSPDMAVVGTVDPPAKVTDVQKIDESRVRICTDNGNYILTAVGDDPATQWMLKPAPAKAPKPKIGKIDRMDGQMNQRGRLPDGSRFAFEYDARAVTWTGKLSIGDENYEDTESFTLTCNSVVKLPLMLDNLYREHLAKQAAEKEKA
jgi:hypothetical protein